MYKLFAKKLLLIPVFLLFSVSVVRCAVPEKVNMQGYLTDAQGEYRQGNFNLTFSIWKDPTSINVNDKLWTESHTNVNVTKGVFQVFLGDVVSFPSDLFTGTNDLWLEIQVENDSPMTPRQKFVSVPFSLLSKDIIDNAISANKLQNNAITSAKINAGEITNSHISNSAAISTSKLSGAVTSIASNGLGSLATKSTVSNSDIDTNAAIFQSKISNSSRTIDADMVDGKHASEFIDTSATGQTKSGGLNISGNVGIAKTNPGFTLDVNGIVNSTGLFVNGSPYASSQWTTSGNNIYYNSGNVGIGTTNPAQKLEINGGCTFGGSIYFSNNYSVIQNRSNNGGYGLIQFANTRIGINVSPYYFDLQLANDSAAKPNGGSWTSGSDMRLKKNITPLTGALAKILSLQGVNYEWINPELHSAGVRQGFIAQEIEKVFPSFVSETGATGKDIILVNGGNAKNLTLPFDFDAYLVEAIKEQNKVFTEKIEKLEKEIQELKKK